MARTQPSQRAKPYDATFKHLVEVHPLDALAFVGVTDVRHVEVVDTDTSTISSAVDKTLKVETGQGEFLVHLEFQSGPDPELIDRAFWYNVTLYRRHRLPVQTTLILLAREADSPRLTGRLEINLPSGWSCHAFQYHVIRLWQVPVAAILTGGVGILPLAPLSQGATERIDDVINTMKQRLDTVDTPAEQDTLWAATFFFMGLAYDSEMIKRLIPRGRHMKESVTYQMVIEEGRQEGRQEGLAEGARKMLLHVGCRRFGKPSRTIVETLEQINGVEHLQMLMDRINQVESWKDLLAKGLAKNGSKKRR